MRCHTSGSDGDQMKICAIIITHNNEDTIENLVIHCRNVMEPDVFVFDNQSDDDTIQVARETGAAILRSQVPDGHTPLPIKALQAAAELHYTHAIILRADEANTHIPMEIPRLVNAAWDAPDKILIGIPPNRRSSLLTLMANLSGWRNFKDAWSAFRLYPIQETLNLGCKETGRHFEPEALVRASWAGIPTAHVDIVQANSTSDLAHSPATAVSVKLMFGMLIRIPRLLWQRLAMV